MNYGTPGQRTTCGCASRPNSMTSGKLTPYPSTGFTAPTVTYAKMRDTQRSALDLNKDVLANVVPGSSFRAAWDNWYLKTWLPFYEKYAGPNADEYAKLGAATYSDELAKRAEAYRQELHSVYYPQYSVQKRADGTPVPRPSGAPPGSGESPPGPGGIPWWGWALGAAVLGGVGYLGYQQVMKNRKPSARK